MSAAARHSFPLPFIKVCGVTREDCLQPLADAGVSAVGINFVPTSPRAVSMDRGRDLVERARELGVLTVGVVRNPTPTDLAALVDALALDYVQLHGAEQPHLLDAVQYDDRPAAPRVIKALSWSGRTEDESRLAAVWAEYSSRPQHAFAAWLVDAYAPHAGGGTGELADWSRLVPRPEVFADQPMLLAGGLVPSNVARAIASVLPDGVDTASGVELSPGIKSAELVSLFAAQARAAFASIASPKWTTT